MVKSEMFSLLNVLGRARAAKEMVGESKLGVVATFDLAESECISEHVRHLHQEKQLNFTPVECPISQGHGADCDISKSHPRGKKQCFHPNGDVWHVLTLSKPVQKPSKNNTAQASETVGSFR